MQTVLRAWILTSALLCGGGWVLSAFHQLNRFGYVLLFVLTAILVAGWERNRPRTSTGRGGRSWHKLLRRCRRPAPAIFCVLALMCLVGGALYAPQNGDSNSYRIPRVLHWLGQEQWHWIRTMDTRMNIAGSGFEWLSAPLILFTRTDRWLFLANLVSYLLLPGLIFSFFTRLNVRPRVAWWWMWLLPSGWCFVMQAGSTLNDSLAAVYALAAMDFALRARASRRVQDLWLSFIALALLTGVKQTNLPLALPWLIAAWPALGLLRQRPLTTAAVAGLCLLASVAPLSLLNIHYTGTWTGIPETVNGQAYAWGVQQKLTSPFWGIVGNAFCLPVQNLLPPYFPFAAAWNRAMSDFVQTPFGSHFRSFEYFGRLGNGVSETTAGIGLGIVFIVVVSWIALRVRRPKLPAPAAGGGDWLLRAIRLAPLISLLAFMAKVGVYQNARYLAPYYPLLFPLVLAGAGPAVLVRRRWWRRLAILVMLFTAGLMVVSRAQPLFPAVTILRGLQAKYPASRAVARLWESYGCRLAVDEVRTFFRNDLPATERVVGYATTTSGAEPGLWLPFGGRRAERVLPEDTAADLQARGIHFVLVEDLVLKDRTIDDWSRTYSGSVVSQSIFPKDPGAPPGRLYLVKLNGERQKAE